MAKIIAEESELFLTQKEMEQLPPSKKYYAAHLLGITTGSLNQMINQGFIRCEHDKIPFTEIVRVLKYRNERKKYIELRDKNKTDNNA